MVEPLAPSRYKVQFTASEDLRDKLERLQALMRDSNDDDDLASVIDAAVTEKLERLEAKRFGKAKSPRRSVDEADTAPGSRYIPAPVRRFVTERDGRRCTYRNERGERCTARDHLEFHHDDPHARGGSRGPENIRLLCRAHNRLLAERDFGYDVMNRYRGPERVREVAPRFGPVPPVLITGPAVRAP